MQTAHALSAFVLLTLLGGCSSSNDDDGGPTAGGTTDEPSGPSTGPDGTGGTGDPGIPGIPGNPGIPDDGEPVEPGDPTDPPGGTPTPGAPDPDPMNPSVPDPGVQNTLRVDYEITVPAYVSDALQVRLVRGEDEVTATWNGDEFWSATEMLPTDTQTDPVVTFYDDNGRLTLGTAELSFRTGTNAAQSVQVTAEQFDTARWDDDQDGVSNLDESIAGTDPRADESGELEMRETFNPFNAFIRPTALEALERASAFHESSMPEIFPYVESVREGPPADTYGYTTPGYTYRLEADLNASGNGSFTRYDQVIEPNDNTIVEEAGTRTAADGQIEWTGTYARVNSSSGVRDGFEFTSTSTGIGASTRQQSGVVTYDTFGTTSDDTGGVPITISYSLTGEPIEGTPDCLPVAGRIEYDEPGPRPAETAGKTTIAKTIDDEYWRVTTVGPDGRVASGFLVRSLGTDFHCDYRS